MIKSKIMLLICLVLCLALSLSGCGDKVEYTAEELCDTIVDHVFNSELTTTVGEKEIQNYFSFDPEILVEYKMVLRTKDEKSDMVAVFRPDGKDNAKKVLEGINQTVSSSANMMKSLSEAEYMKINNRLLYEIDDMYILIIADDYETPRKYLEEIKAEPVK